ncbi:hypothetical protein C8A05DRAFT_44220 [Staphylotrichum tortipilum]|uniref:Uncharacterized protein n=1 Tax=Staphylotrichum tortipilum TaxID=2831512 RepID=A0AAN6RT09_9PEZI|nr:hypothetical protein C8A05DRAFT_44220 [Staphylotrichum longicolle]
MILSGIMAIAGLVTSAVAGVVTSNIKVPPPNPIPVVIQGIPNFSVSKFEAQGVVLSDRNYISFHLTPYPGATPTHCFAIGTTAAHMLTTIPQTWCTPINTTDPSSSSTPSTPTASSDPTSNSRVWFSWTMGEDVDPTAPTASGIFGMAQTTGAYIKVVRQVDERTRDEAVRHVPAWYLGRQGEGMLEHQVFSGPSNFSLLALRFTGEEH